MSSPRFTIHRRAALPSRGHAVTQPVSTTTPIIQVIPGRHPGEATLRWVLAAKQLAALWRRMRAAATARHHVWPRHAERAPCCFQRSRGIWQDARAKARRTALCARRRDRRARRMPRRSSR